MFRSLILAAVLLAAGPLVANAGEITLLPSVKLQIGDRDNYGNYWDRHDNGWHKGWYKGRDKAWERGYRAGWNDRDDHRGGWGRGPGGRGHGHGHGHH